MLLYKHEWCLKLYHKAELKSLLKGHSALVFYQHTFQNAGLGFVLGFSLPTHSMFYCFCTALPALHSPVLASGYMQSCGLQQKCDVLEERWKRLHQPAIMQHPWCAHSANSLQRMGVLGCGSYRSWHSPSSFSLGCNRNSSKTQHPPSALRDVVLGGRCGFRSADIMEMLHLLTSQKAKHIGAARNVTLRSKKAQALWSDE